MSETRKIEGDIIKVEKEPFLADNLYLAIAEIIKGKHEQEVDYFLPDFYFGDNDCLLCFKPDGKIVIEARPTYPDQDKGSSHEYDPANIQSDVDRIVASICTVIDRTRQIYGAMTDAQRRKEGTEEIVKAVINIMYFEDFIEQKRLRKDNDEGYYPTQNEGFFVGVVKRQR